MTGRQAFGLLFLLLGLTAFLPFGPHDTLAQSTTRPAYKSAATMPHSRGVTTRPTTRPTKPPVRRVPSTQRFNRLTTRPIGFATTRPPYVPPASRPVATRQPMPPRVPGPPRALPRPAPQIYAGAMSGNPVIFPDKYRGKLVLVSFWATWCPHCKKELPFWRELYARYRDRGVEFISVTTDANRKRGPEIVQPFLAQNGITWESIYDSAPDMSQLWGADSIPMSFLCDGDTGRIVAEGNWLRGAGLEKTLQKHLAAKFGPASTQPNSAPTTAPAANR